DTPVSDELTVARQQLTPLTDKVSDPERPETLPPRRVAEAMLELSAALHRSLNADDVLNTLLTGLGEVIALDAVCIIRFTGQKAHIAHHLGYPEFKEADRSLSVNLKTLPQVRQYKKLRSVQVIPRDHDRHAWAAPLGVTWLKSGMVAPLIIKKKVVGLVMIDSAAPEAFSADDVARMEQLLDHVELAITNAQLYGKAQQEIVGQVRALENERNFVSAVLDTAGALVLVLDAKGRILRFNRACEAITGYTFDEVHGQIFWEMLLSFDERLELIKHFNEVMIGTGANSFQTHLMTKDTRQRLINWTNTTLFNEAGEVEYVISIGTDITESHQLEERLVAIHQLGRELNLLRDEAAIWEIALETAAFLLEFKSAGYGVVTNDSLEEFDYLYQPVRGVPTKISLNLPMDTEGRIGVLKTYSERAGNVWSGEEEAETDPAEQASYPWLTAPMMVGDRLIGVLDLESRSRHPFTANDHQLLQTLADQTAVAIENARLHHEARHRVDELTTMNMVGQAITSTLDLEETLTVITDHSIRLLEATAAAVVLNDEPHGSLWFHAASGGSSDFVRGKRLPAGEGIVGWVIEHGEPVLISDVSIDPRFFSKFDQQTGFSTESVICAPLRTGNQTIGAIEVINKKVGSFTPEDLQLLSWLATPAATAIDNAGLFEAEHRARKQADILRGATATLTSTLNSNKVLQSILVHLKEVVSFDNAHVFLRNGDWLEVVAGRGSTQAEEPVSVVRYPIENPLYREIEETGHPVMIADAQKDPRFEIWGNPDTIRGWMGVPLTVQNEVIGCLALDSQNAGAYSTVEAELAQAFANQAAVAIQNARLFEQVRTGRKRLQSLSRRLVEIQETERRRIARELHDEAGQSLSSLMVDLRLLERKVEDPKAVLAGILDLKHRTNDISENLHRLATDLRPASLDHLGLETTLRQYIENFGQQNELETQFEAVGLDDRRLQPSVETNLYRVVQEALTNVLRHSQATQVDVLLERRGEHLVAIIEDNGVGFDPDAAAQSGRLGLVGIRERAEMLDGNLMIESTPGVGTTIYVEVPYVNSNSNR
ncbi:MAG: GAF domain-containing protein, partial [Anaerolineae bacterium]|nr:GAF domain-containing protein [Anaerolineae bacterium]